MFDGCYGPWFGRLVMPLTLKDVALHLAAASVDRLFCLCPCPERLGQPVSENHIMLKKSGGAIHAPLDGPRQTWLDSQRQTVLYWKF